MGYIVTDSKSWLMTSTNRSDWEREIIMTNSKFGHRIIFTRWRYTLAIGPWLENESCLLCVGRRSHDFNSSSTCSLTWCVAIHIRDFIRVLIIIHSFFAWIHRELPEYNHYNARNKTMKFKILESIGPPASP